jgi:uncharacterized protein
VRAGSDDAAHAVLWRRLDAPGHDAARVRQRGSTWDLSGAAVFAHERQSCRLDYAIVCDSRWRTVSGRITGWIGGTTVDVAVAVDAAGRWRLDGLECPAVEGCRDLDLEFSPSTNLLPIRRLDLAVGAEAPVRAAWLRFPGFTLEPLEQVYRRIRDRTYRYESNHGRFVAELRVSAAGFVTRYADLWQAENEAPCPGLSTP